ncbi:MAG TPA: aminotransferase class V-fold PLP-dependent enzyme [Anaeromyxobacteraceae bacterium]|jgi:glutamate/tyrosine decarboxylase-like PLP-dependent enzyme|nr:aminotransferase class V-fold PLP-dependent enzyme [Anaeromyxobacteraceae bacterium]
MPSSPTAVLLTDAARRAAAYLDGLDTRPVAPSPDAVSALRALDGPLPKTGADPAAVLEELDRLISPATMAMAGPRFFGFVIGGALPATLAANVLASAWDQNSAKWAATPGTAALEKVALRWTLEALGLPLEAGGGFVTGATVANFTALAAARHAVLARAGWDVEARGLFGAPPITVVVGAEAHVSVLKALAMLGLGRERLVTVPVDGQGRLRPDALPPLRPPAIVCLQAGNVNTGAFDPAPAVIARAREAGAWVHVDGAFGLWAAAAPRRAHLTEGMADADSWATDAHKWLNVPYDSGLALVRDDAALRAAMGISAAYLPEAGARDPADSTPELSRRARGVEVWAALRNLGRSGLADLVERTCRHAERFADGLSAASHQVLNDVVLNQVLVSFGDDERTRRVIAGLQADGTCWCGGTVWQGKTAMRISVSSWATTEDDVERSLAAMLRVARS